MRPRVAVIGGGISGLAAANTLADCAPLVDVMLLEAGRRLGGVLETTQQDGFLMEAAADGFLTTPPSAVELCRRLGLEDSLVGTEPRRRRAFVVRQGRLRPIPSGFLVMAPSRIWPMLASPVLSARGKLRLGLEWIIPRKKSAEDEPLAAFARRRFGREIFERLIQPLVGGIYAADCERLSIAATMPRFPEMERQHGSLTRAALRQRRSPTGEGSGGARYGHFATLRAGMMSLVSTLASRLPPGSVRLESPVERIVSDTAGDRWLLSIGGNHPYDLQVDGVIVAAPAYRAGALLANLDPVLAHELARIEYASCAVISLGYRRQQIAHSLNGFGFVVPLIEQRTILSCSFSSVKYGGRASADSALMRVYIGGACQEGLLRLSDEELVELAERELAELLQIRGKPVLRHFTRHRRAMPQYHVGHQDRVARMTTRLSTLPMMALAGSAYDGVGIPACIRSGETAATAILDRLRNRQFASRLCCR